MQRISQRDVDVHRQWIDRLARRSYLLDVCAIDQA